MENKKFGPHLPMILVGKDIDAIYDLWGVDYAVEIELPDGETPETVRPGYCGAYRSHFEALAELGMAFTQMVPNVFLYFLAS